MSEKNKGRVGMDSFILFIFFFYIFYVELYHNYQI